MSSDNEEQKSHLDEDVCLSLLQGLLTADERDRVLAHLDDCPRCQGFLQERAGEWERLRASRRLRFEDSGEVTLERPEEILRAQEAEGDESRPRAPLSEAWIGFLAALRKPRFRFAFGFVAAAVLFLVLVPPLLRSPHDASLIWLPVEDRSSPKRTLLREASDELDRGIEAYARRDLREAIELLEKAEASGPYDTFRRVYLGSALAWSGKYEEATEVLRTVRTRVVPGRWGPITRWTLYVALKESGRKASADSLLRLLVDEPGEVGERARQLMQQ